MTIGTKVRHTCDRRIGYVCGRTPSGTIIVQWANRDGIMHHAKDFLRKV